MSLFGLEIILSCIAKVKFFYFFDNYKIKEKYIFSFFFWLDIVSTASLLFDIEWITNSFMDSNDGAAASA